MKVTGSMIKKLFLSFTQKPEAMSKNTLYVVAVAETSAHLKTPHFVAAAATFGKIVTKDLVVMTLDKLA